MLPKKSIKDLATPYIRWVLIYNDLHTTESYELCEIMNMYLLHPKMFFILHLYWTSPVSKIHWNPQEFHPLGEVMKTKLLKRNS